MLMNLQQYEKAAQEIADGFVSNAETENINQLATKVAEAHNLNPEQIRTVTRLANVAVFQELFEKKADGDKMIQFEVGDPEVVINALYKDAEKKFDREKTAEYDLVRDYYSDLPADTEDTVKKAEEKEAVEILRVNPRELKFNLEEALEKLGLEKYRAEYSWKDCMEKAANSYKLANGFDVLNTFPEFEKNAAAVMGEDIKHEVNILRGMIGGDVNTPFAGGLKMASLLEHHVGIIEDRDKDTVEFLKRAQEHRHDFVRHKKGQDLLTDYIKRAGTLI